MKYRVV